jgi:D-alanyl-D-alanine carboxypeptidase (penicillin-binding protein 5/6)
MQEDTLGTETGQGPTHSGTPKILPVLLAFSVLAVLVVTAIGRQSHTSEIVGDGKNNVEKTTEDRRKLRHNPFNGIRLEARAAYVLDTTTEQVLFAKNGELQLPLASLTKIMTAIVALESVPSGTIITIDKKSLKNEGDAGLLAGERWLLHDLLGFSLLVSSNDGADAVASVVGSLGKTARSYDTYKKEFVEKMNRKAKELGLTQTYFVNETGLDISKSSSGAYGSARDMAQLFKYALEHAPDVLEVTRYDTLKFNSLNKITHIAKNTNIINEKIPVLVASKTGYTDLAGGNLIVAFEAGLAKPIIVVVLGSTLDGRFADVEKLIWTTLAYLQDYDIETGN